jgi:hypothetical protein
LFAMLLHDAGITLQACSVQNQSHAVMAVCMHVADAVTMCRNIVQGH